MKHKREVPIDPTRPEPTLVYLQRALWRAENGYEWSLYGWGNTKKRVQRSLFPDKRSPGLYYNKDISQLKDQGKWPEKVFLRRYAKMDELHRPAVIEMYQLAIYLAQQDIL